MLKAACILLFIGLAASDSSMNSIITRLLDQARTTKNRNPVILVINSRAMEETSSEEAPFRQSSEENGISMLKVLAELQKPRPKPSLYRARPSIFKEPHARKPGKRFPVYKSILSLRNSLRCGARDECKDECTELPKKKQQKKCNKKCEVKYECDEEPDCQEDDCDGNPSTRGPPASEEKPRGCTRC